MSLESRLDKLSNEYSWVFVSFRDQELWLFNLVVRSVGVIELFSTCVHLSTTNVEHLGSIPFLEVMKAQSV